VTASQPVSSQSQLQASSVGKSTKERCKLVPTDDGYLGILYGANVRYASAKGEYTGVPLLANAPSLSSPESFRPVPVGANWGLLSRQFRMYVSADLDQSNAPLRVTSEALTSLETFTIESSQIRVTGVTVTPSTASVVVGNTLQLGAMVMPTNASDKAVIWSSSNAAVATVGDFGLVTGKNPGSAIVTATTADGAMSARCTVTVTKPKANGKRRALLIGQEKYKKPNTVLKGNHKDMEWMRLMLSKGGYAKKNIKTLKDLTGRQLKNALETISDPSANWGWGKISENDITLVFFVGHGGIGTLCGVDNEPDSTITVDSVRESLEKVPGTIIFITNSCYSGQFIRPKGPGEAQVDISPEELNQKVIDAFAKSSVSKTTLSESASSWKFHVLTGCSPLEVGRGPVIYNKKPISMFVHGLTLAGGFDVGIKFTGRGAYKSLPGNGKVSNILGKKGKKTATMAEVFKYTDAKARWICKYFKPYWKIKSPSAMLWPPNSNLVFVTRK